MTKKTERKPRRLSVKKQAVKTGGGAKGRRSGSEGHDRSRTRPIPYDVDRQRARTRPIPQDIDRIRQRHAA